MTKLLRELTLKIVQTVQRLLENQNQLIQDEIAFYAWRRGSRLILIFNPLGIRNPEAVLQNTFVHRLSTALGGVKVVPTNTRGIFLQIGFQRAPLVKLVSKVLNLKEQPSPLHVPLGLTHTGILWARIIEMDSILIGGTRRMGKSNLLHTWIQALLYGKVAFLILWDGKQGAEFGRYAGLENVLAVNDLEEGIQHVTQEMGRRMALLRESGHPSIEAYNKYAKAKLNPLVLVIDEAAQIPDELQMTLSKPIALGGACGIYPVIATQRPDAQAVQSILKANLSTRIALPVPSRHDSQVILGRSGAEKLPKIKGRFNIVRNARLI